MYFKHSEMIRIDGILIMLYQSVKKGSQKTVDNLQNIGVEEDAEESKHEKVDGQYEQNAVTNGEVQTSLKESQQMRMT